MPTRAVSKCVDEFYREGEEGILNKKKVMFEDVREAIVKDSCFKSACCSDEESLSSSIGKNSDLSSEKCGDGEEVQSPYKGPLDAMEALEEVLPIRRGISRFYKGKSKSFASLGDAAASIKDIAKPENAYVRRRRNLLSYNLLNWDKPRGAISKRGGGGGVTRTTTLALALATTNSDSTRNDFSTWRSFSLADLQHCAAAATASNSNEIIATNNK